MTDVYQMQTLVFGVLVPGRNIPGFPSVPSSLRGHRRSKRHKDIKNAGQDFFSFFLNTSFNPNNNETFLNCGLFVDTF